MKKALSLFILFSVLFLFVSCSQTESESIDTGDFQNENAVNTEVEVKPSSYDGDMTLEMYFGSRTGHYTGEIDVTGVPDGNGIFVSTNSEGEQWTYDGEWKSGHWQGKGKTIWSNGNSYEGEYKDDFISGNGIYIYSDGCRYEGQFADGVMWGNGTFYYPDGYYFVGDFATNEAEIHGIYCSPNGDSVDAIWADGEITVLPKNDFFMDESRQKQYEELYKNYKYSDLEEVIKQYLEDNDTIESDSAYQILSIIQPLIPYEATWSVAKDSFDGSTTLTFSEAETITRENCVGVSVQNTALNIKIGFRRNGWLFFDRIELSIDGNKEYSASVKSHDTTRTVISGNTIEEYCFCNFYDSVLEKLKDAETVILRFSNESSKENYDHTLTKAEKDALYCGYLLQKANKDLSNLLYRYNKK